MWEEKVVIRLCFLRLVLEIGGGEQIGGQVLTQMTQQPGRLPLGRYLCGTLTRDAEDYYLFVEHVAKALWWVKRNPHVFVGRYINVNRKSDGTIYPTFNRPDYNEKLTFTKFCMEAAKELRQVAKLVDSATGLGEGEGRIAKISVNISYSCFF